ncbi:hypothetical protein Tco_1372064, partial [Tanacetum coccineum]
KRALLWVEFHAYLLEPFEGFSYVCHHVHFVHALCYHIAYRTGNEKLSYARHLLPLLLGDSCHVRVLQSEYVDIVFERLGQLLFGLCGELSSDGHRLLQVIPALPWLVSFLQSELSILQVELLLA